MTGIADTIRQFQNAFVPGSVAHRSTFPARLSALQDFGTNPGDLKAWVYVPRQAASLPLVVVLHGCTQTAADYDRGSGWSDLAEQHGFAVLFPEQQRANNPNLCFNWFQREDTAGDRGETLSILQMMDAVGRRHAIAADRVFVTGLSAGGAMANVLLATHPERFAGGAIIAGLPYGAAASVTQAMQKMRGSGLASEAEYANLVRRASGHGGSWPSISVWHGDADHTVNVANADATVGQWRGVHCLGATPDRIDMLDGQRHRVWTSKDGRPAVEDYRIAGLGHGTPLKTSGPTSCGRPGPHMLEAGISSTWRQASTWGLISNSVRTAASPDGAEPTVAPISAATVSREPTISGVAATIERALRAAGLMPNQMSGETSGRST